MYVALSDLKIRAKVKDVLATLQQNRAKHQEIVSEARESYRQKARALAVEKIEEMLASKKLIPLVINIQPPIDYTAQYDTAIKMLELATDEVVELDATQVQHFVMDKWDWKNQFINSNKMYSQTVAAMDDE